MPKKSSDLLFGTFSIFSARFWPTVQKKLLNLLATVVGSSDVATLLSLTLEGASRLDLLGSTDRIIFQVSREFQLCVKIHLFRQSFDFSEFICIFAKEQLLCRVSANDVSFKYLP